MSYEPGFDRCYKCKTVQVGIWQGRGKSRFFTCLRCFCTQIRKSVKAERGPNHLKPRGMEP